MTTQNHLLLKHASTYERFNGSLAPEGCEYDAHIGAWVLEGTDVLFVDTPDRKRPQTKKEDIETGEDRKSE